VPCSHAGTHGVNDADDLVAGNDRLRRVSAQALDGQDIGMADPAAAYPQPDLPGAMARLARVPPGRTFGCR
jgi:hypothetical protein